MNDHNDKNKNRPSRRPDLDKLPPHSFEAEQGVLGCILLEPERSAETLKECEERFGGNCHVFYGVAHQQIYAAMLGVRREGAAVDIITLHTWLRQHGLLEQVRGVAYLSELCDAPATPQHLSQYIDIVWSMFLARRKVQDATTTVERIMAEGGLSEPGLEADLRRQEEFSKLLTRGEITPKYLKPPWDFAEEVFNHLFGGHGEDVPGLPLPIAFPLKLRLREMTLVSGDNGSGKSTFLNYVALHLAQHPGEKILVASLEMPPAVTLWILASQLLGSKRLADFEGNRQRAVRALEWLNERFLFYDFTGIADWREILDTMAYAAKHKGMTCAIVDSVMRVGIPDDDYAQQGLAAARFAQAAKDGNYHLMLVVHQNKGEGRGKDRIRGSKQWVDNADNVLVVERNEMKGEKIDELRWELGRAKLSSPQDQGEISGLERQLAEQASKWDTRIVLRKQRWPGTQQNGAKYIWYDAFNFQFRDKPEDPTTDWLEQWGPKGSS